MVGECMSRHNAWACTVDKLRPRLSKWKVTTFSIGGRLTLLKAVLGASPLYNMSIFKEVTVADKVQGVVSSSFRRPMRARWIYDLSGDGEFRVKDVRNFLDNLFLSSYADAKRWVKYIPIKINVFVWRARRNFLPSRVNLSRRGSYSH
nr:RNA-directed DNA polymerase, eukaryota [Tanacetum cinerariifolium]